MRAIAALLVVLSCGRFAYEDRLPGDATGGAPGSGGTEGGALGGSSPAGGSLVPPGGSAGSPVGGSTAGEPATEGGVTAAGGEPAVAAAGGGAAAGEPGSGGSLLRGGSRGSGGSRGVGGSAGTSGSAGSGGSAQLTCDATPITSWPLCNCPYVTVWVCGAGTLQHNAFRPDRGSSMQFDCANASDCTAAQAALSAYCCP